MKKAFDGKIVLQFQVPNMLTKTELSIVTERAHSSITKLITTQKHYETEVKCAYTTLYQEKMT